MKLHHPAAAVVILCWLVGLKSVAGEGFNLESNVYVYRNSDFDTVKNPGAASGNETRWVAFRSPATIEFDQEMLTLDGHDFAWSGGENPPDRFSLIAAPTVQEAQLMTAAELDEFVTAYYQNPQPELIARAIEAFGPSGFVKDRAQVYVGFFAEVFAANPGRMVEWRKVMDRQDRPTREVFKQARRLSRTGALLASEDQSVAFNDRCWGAFFASGNSDYLSKLVDNLRYIDDEQPPLFWTGATAMWSLARNGPAHPLVKVTLETAQDKTDHPRTREIIGEVLTWNLNTMRENILERGRGLKSADPTRVGHPWSLHDHSRFVGPAAGQPPPKSIWGNR